MRYPYVTILCIVGAVLNAFFAGMGLVRGDKAALSVNIVLCLIKALVAMVLSAREWGFMEKLFNDYARNRNAED